MPRPAIACCIVAMLLLALENLRRLRNGGCGVVFVETTVAAANATVAANATTMMMAEPFDDDTTTHPTTNTTDAPNATHPYQEEEEEEKEDPSDPPPPRSFDVSQETCAHKLPKLAGRENLVSCGELGKNPYPTMDPKHEPFPTGLDCGLVVIAAGSPRCGSTTQLAYARDALDLLGVTPVVSEYWNIHLHYGVVPEAQKTTRGQEISHRLRSKITNTTKPSLVVMKSHEYDPRLVGLCRHALVLTTHRHPFETERSKKETFYGDVPRTKYARNYWNVPEVAAPQRCWADSHDQTGVVGVLDQAYENFQEDPVAAFLEVYESVEAAVLEAGLPLRRPKAIARALRHVVAHLTDEKNKGLPSSRTTTTTTTTTSGGRRDASSYWTTDEQAQIACLYRRWFERYNYTYG